MLSHRFYYALKPFVPWRLRMALRRIAAGRKRAHCQTIWPIDESTNRPPTGWPGWPEGRKFAFVLTHDVEGPEGLARCRQLAELEMKFGFRSSFNFIPEGPYRVPAELREWLTKNGFEVGVHDLHHDGKLFATWRGFAAKAKRINHYLREWQASGYRSGFMLRNLEWLHGLEIAYDASTFDTDPFEPQPDGAGTIFPYWIPSPDAPGSASPHDDRPGRTAGTSARDGYVELPYTLPQDSTLFLLLREKSPEIWLRKLEWIAAHGGMALANVHPDYIHFAGAAASHREYSEAFYTELLRSVAERYRGQYWNVLPRELAHWFKQNCRLSTGNSTPPIPAAGAPPPGPKPGLKGKRAAVLLYSRYPADPRPRRAAEAMIEAGMQVDLLCLADSEKDAPVENVRGVQVFRVPLKHRRDSKWMYLWQYGRFFASSMWFLSSRGLRHRYDVVHVHNMPDFLAFAAVVPKLRGAKIILDLHDPMPELMESIYGLQAGNWKVKFLRLLERWSIAFANLSLTPNITFKNLFVARSCRPEKMQIVMNSPQQDIFDPTRYPAVRREPSVTAEFRVMHHGSIVHRHGVDLLVEAVARLRPVIPGIRLDIYGHATPFLDTVLALAQELGAADIVRYHGAKNQVAIAEAILDCDVGVVPNRRSAFIEINFPTRLFEYLAMHRPVIAPSTQGIRDYFQSGQMILFEPNNVEDLAARIRWVWENPQGAREVMERGEQVYRGNLWTREKERFLGHVSRLLSRT
jgi:glycosyltransferase involved in cell wall biosynthesis